MCVRRRRGGQPSRDASKRPSARVHAQSKKKSLCPIPLSGMGISAHLMPFIPNQYVCNHSAFFAAAEAEAEAGPFTPIPLLNYCYSLSNNYCVVQVTFKAFRC